MKIASSQSTNADTTTACDVAYAELCERLGSVPDLLYLGWSVTHPGEALLARLADIAPDVRVHGASSCLGGMTEAGFVSDRGCGLVMLGLSDPAGAYGVGGTPITGSVTDAAANAVIDALDDADRPGEIPALVRLSAPPGHEEEVIAGIESVLGQDVPIVGGSAADNTVEGNWQLAANARLDASQIVVSVLFPSVATAFAFHSGYSPTATSGRATRASRRTLYEIDGEPAAAVYNRWTDGSIADALDRGGNVLASTTLHPIGRVVGELGGVPYFRLSHPDGVSPDGALTLFSDIGEGDELVLMEGSVDSLVSRAGRVAEAALSAGELRPDEISGALVVYCAGCMLTARSEMDRVVDGLNVALGHAPFLGAFTFGEQGCFVGGENRHGNLMISVMVFGR
jgi:hypothetical protein